MFRLFLIILCFLLEYHCFKLLYILYFLNYSFRHKKYSDVFVVHNNSAFLFKYYKILI